jgi:hypothetical protein
MRLLRGNRNALNALLAIVSTSLLLIYADVSCEPYVWKEPSLKGQPEKRITSIVCIDVAKNQEHGVIRAVQIWDRSLAQWKQMVPVVDWTLESTCDYLIKELDPPEDAKPTTLAITSAVGGKFITLYKGRYEADALGITLHELGHALGARHMEGTIMAPHIIYKAFTCPDAATVAQVAAFNEIDPSILSWCIAQ